MKTTSALVELADLAAQQRGFVTAAQATMRGVSKPQLSLFGREGLLENLTHGVYKFTTHELQSDDSLRAEWFRLKPEKLMSERLAALEVDFFVSGTTAAWFTGRGDFRPNPFQFVSTQRQQSRSESVAISISTKLEPSTVTITDGLPILKPTQILESLFRSSEDLESIRNYVADVGIAHFDFDQIFVGASKFAQKYGMTTQQFRSLAFDMFESISLSQFHNEINRLSALARNAKSLKTVMPKIAEIEESLVSS